MRKGLELKAATLQAPRAWPWMRWLRDTPLGVASLPALLFFIVPILAILMRIPPGQLFAEIQTEEIAQAIRISLTTTLIATGFTILCGTPLAILLARRRFFFKPVLDTLIDLAMVLPPSVAGIALLITFGRRGLFGPALTDLHVQIVFTSIAVILSQIFVAAPFYIRTATAALTEVRRELEEAAALDGANEWRVLWSITLPLIFPSLLAGAIMTWARALGEFGATILFAGNLSGRTQTIPLAIYIGFEQDPTLTIPLSLSAILLIIAFVVLFCVKGILRQRIASFV
jgi:molybdate transport system permease protein